MFSRAFLLFLLVVLASSSLGALVALRLNEADGTLLQVINTGRNGSGNRIRMDAAGNVFVVAGASNDSAVLQYSPKGILIAKLIGGDDVTLRFRDASSVAVVNNITYVSAQNASDLTAPSSPLLYTFSQSGAFLGVQKLNQSTFGDGSAIPTTGFYDMRAVGDVLFLGTQNPFGVIALNVTSGQAKTVKFQATQTFPVALAITNSTVITWSNSSDDSLLFAIETAGSDTLAQSSLVVPDRTAARGLDVINGSLITYDVKRQVFKRISRTFPVWFDYLSVPSLGSVQDFAMDPAGNLLVLVDRDSIPVDYCGTGILGCNSNTTRCQATLTSGSCLCKPGFSRTPLADNFCLPGCLNETCSDGSCVLSVSECPPVQACPQHLPKRCPQGNCIPAADICEERKPCSTGLVLCIDGACRKNCSTAPFAGCPQYTCPDGACVERFDYCKGCNLTACTDAPPLAVFPNAQSYEPHSFRISTEPFTIGLPSISIPSRIMLAVFSFPQRFVDQDSALISFAEASSLKHRDIITTRRLASKIVAISVNDGNIGFTANISLLTQIPEGRTQEQMRFARYDEASQQWKYLSSPSVIQSSVSGQFYSQGVISQSGEYAVVLDATDFPGYGIFLIVLGGVIVLAVVVIFIAKAIVAARKK